MANHPGTEWLNTVAVLFSHVSVCWLYLCCLRCGYSWSYIQLIVGRGLQLETLNSPPCDLPRWLPLYFTAWRSQGSEREVEAADLSKALNLSSRSVTSCIISASWCWLEQPIKSAQMKGVEKLIASLNFWNSMRKRGKFVGGHPPIQPITVTNQENSNMQRVSSGLTLLIC